MLKLLQILAHQQIWLENSSSSKLNRVHENQYDSVNHKQLLLQSSRNILHLSQWITEQLWLEGASGGHLVQTSCLRRTTKNRLTRALLTVSNNGDSTTFMGNLCQCTGTLCFLTCRPNLCFQPVPAALVLWLDTPEKTLAPFGYIYALLKIPKLPPSWRISAHP